MRKIEKYLTKKIKVEGAIHLSLLDPVNITTNKITTLIKDIERAGSSGIMIGGSTVCDMSHLTKLIKKIKNLTLLPIILFPNNVSSLSNEADAVWFMSLINSRNPYYITGAQMIAAFTVKKFNLETLPMGYLLVGEGGAAGIIGDANLIPYDKPELAAAYALAARFLGMRFIYLEAGSGANFPIPPNLISTVRKAISNITLIVGGGIRDNESAYQTVLAGADIIVTGTLVEHLSRSNKLVEVVSAVRHAGSIRRS